MSHEGGSRALSIASRSPRHGLKRALWEWGARLHWTSPGLAPSPFLMDTLRISVVTRCPGGEGCKCREHFGLGDWLLTATGDTHGLPTLRASQDAPASVLSLIDDECDGTLTCACSRCESERARLMARPRKAPKQPWDLAA